ncbi:MAG: 30S ribosomal protein S4 [Deltaproteobacteria bacterium]|nr:30S ribosomal protein S4 [Deltaproteobacteria bacterium]
MARYRGPVCRMCRVEREKLFLKGERCFTSKCAIERREGTPGQHGKKRSKFSEYKTQLREKQKVKRIYGLGEKQFRANFVKSAKTKGVTGTEMLLSLERRLDNMVYRIGFGTSRNHSRQVVKHGMVLVNGKRVNIPSYKVSVGDVIEIREKSKTGIALKAAMEFAQSRSIPEWITLDREAMRGTVNALPSREQLTQPINEQLIVELYSK